MQAAAAALLALLRHLPFGSPSVAAWADRLVLVVDWSIGPHLWPIERYLDRIQLAV